MDSARVNGSEKTLISTIREKMEKEKQGKVVDGFELELPGYGRQHGNISPKRTLAELTTVFFS